MSFFLDPPALFVLGFALLLVKNRFRVSGQITRVIGSIVILVFVLVSGALYLDWISWPINLFDWTPPIFQSIGGRAWMLHTDLTGITSIPDLLALLFFILYPLWMFLGYEVSRELFDPHTLNILAGGPFTYDDVKSRKRAKRPEEPTLLSVVRHDDPVEALRQAMGKIGGISQYVSPGDTVMIKLNICGGNPLIKGSFTTPEVASEIVRLVNDAGGKIIVVDSDMVWTDFEPVAEAQGWYKWAKDTQVPLFNLRKQQCVRFDFGPNSAVKTTVVSKIALDADVIISVPVLKTHLMTNITCGMKNMYGTFPTREKAKYHKAGIEDVIVDMNRAFTPTLTIIDGSLGGESIGPLSCKPVNSKIIIASNDVVAADAAGAQIIGYSIEEIEHVTKAAEEGIGNAQPLDWRQLDDHPHPKDGQWLRPDPHVSKFYNTAMEQIMIIPGTTKIMDAISDAVLYDSETLPFINSATAVVLGVMSDVLGSVFGFLHGKPSGKKKKIGRKIEEKYPEIDISDQVLELFTRQGVKSFIVAFIMVMLALAGLYYGGFWDQALIVLNQPTGNMAVYIFLGGLLLCGLSVLVYSQKLKPGTLLGLGMFAATLAFLDEFTFSSLGFWTYLSGDFISLLFAVFGWPIFIAIAFGYSDWILKYILHIPVFSDKKRNVLPAVVVILVSGLLFLIEGFVPLLSSSSVSIITISAVLLLVATSLLALYFGWHHTFKQNVVLFIFGGLIGVFMEFMGSTIGFWSYPAVFIISPPVFLIFYWGIRVLAIGGLMTLAGSEILQWGYSK